MIIYKQINVQYINCEKADLDASYSVLWAELKWLYDKGKAEYMVSSL